MNAADTAEAVPRVIATPTDAAVVDPDAPIADAADEHAAALLYARAAGEAEGTDPAAARVCRMLHGALSLSLQENAIAPFAPMVLWADGRRSAAPEDFAARRLKRSWCSPRARHLLLRAAERSPLAARSAAARMRPRRRGRLCRSRGR